MITKLTSLDIEVLVALQEPMYQSQIALKLRTNTGTYIVVSVRKLLEHGLISYLKYKNANGYKVKMYSRTDNGSILLKLLGVPI